MADVKNGGGYGRFYNVEEVKGAATTATDKVAKLLNSQGAVAGLTNSPADLEKLKKSIINGSTSLGKNILGQIPGVETANLSAASSIKNLSLQDTGKFEKKLAADLKPPLPNILSYYTSYNYVFTLSVLSDDQINFPDQTYKKGEYGPLILRSAGGSPDKEIVETAYGKFDFFLDDLTLDGIVGFDKVSGNTTTKSLSFKVIEPYSMGLFFQSLQTAALKANRANYLEIPLLLTIEFKGHIFDKDVQLLNQRIDFTTKHIPMRLQSVQMKVTGKGSVYDVKAYPFNEQGFANQFAQSKTELNIRANVGGPYTVQSVLQTGEQSLQAIINQYFQSKVKNKDVEVADQCLILFPAELSSDKSGSNTNNESLDRSATTNAANTNNNAIFTKLGVSIGSGNYAGLVQAEGDQSVNKIGQASIGFNALNKGDSPFPKDVGVYDEATGIYTRGNVAVDYKNADFKFNQGTNIVDVINQVILASDYGRNALSPDQRSDDGMIYWWRVETELYILSAPESNKSGIKPKLVVYRVVPYKVDGSFVLPTNAKRPKLDNVKKQSLKEYNYIYTGKNTEVLDFNIDFKVGFYTQLPANTKEGEEKELSASTSAAANEQSLDDQKRANISANPLGAPIGSQKTPQQIRTDSIGTSTYKQGGTGFDDNATRAARNFHDIITKGFDMINLDLQILGDPYYIADSGLGNYTAKGVQGFDNITSDGSINYQNGQVVITVNFRTPIDINMETGYYNFGNTQPVIQFSGLYIVQKLTSLFSKGKFVQTLKLMRMRGQDDPTAPDPEKTSILSAENVSDSVTKTGGNSSSSYWGETSRNNNNQNSPNPSLPGVINSGGFTI